MAQGFVLGSADRPFDNILNLRDIGRSVNGFYGLNILREGVLFRSARPDDASERDKQRLADEIGLTTVIDLRSSTEHALAAQRRRDARLLENQDSAGPENITSAAAAAAAAAEDEHLLNLPNVTRHMISMTGRAFERMLLWRLDWYNFIKALGLVASGYRTDAARLIATNVIKPRGLTGLAQDMLDCGGGEIRNIFDILADTTSYPAIIHCTQGKDRTGLVVTLLLLLLGVVPLDTISADYAKSEAELEPELEYLMKEITQIGLDEDYAKCPPGFVEAVKGYLDSKYGGVEAYLLLIGVGQEKLGVIRRQILLEGR